MTITPARRQYLRIKKQHQDAILLFRMGDFFETFDDDARVLARELDIALTSKEMGRGQRIPLAGIPCQSAETHLARLIGKGFKVAICEQVSDPKKSNGLVDREVVRVVTPGTVIEDSILDSKTNNFLAALLIEGNNAGFAYVDISTCEFATTESTFSHIEMEISRITPSELLLSNEDTGGLSIGQGIMITKLTSEAFHHELAIDRLKRHLGVKSLEPYGCDKQPLAARAAGAVLDYLRKTNKVSLGQINSLQTYSTSSYMVLDPQTRRNLELFEGGRWSDSGGSLFSVLDKTHTPMGSRLLRKFLGQPLIDLERLVRRQDAVSWFHASMSRRSRVTVLLKFISDIERLINRIQTHVATPRDLIALRMSLESAPKIRGVLEEDNNSDLFTWLTSKIMNNDDVVQLIKKAIIDEPALSVGQGLVIRREFSHDLDALRSSARSAQDYIASLEKRERKRTGIKSLKVGYSKVFGYYIAVSKSNLSQVPENYIRRQTLVNGERFITPEMKEYESQVLSAQEHIAELEAVLYKQVCEQIGLRSQDIFTTANAIGQVDALCSFAEIADQNNYVRPEINDRDIIEIREGRHPVVDLMLPAGSFVPNDVTMSCLDEQLILLTGPNMAGKSTYIRQIAIITLMAQIGSFVPAKSAKIGLVDRIFTRVGLQDDLAQGQSTFMVEMVETAAILHHATKRSLIVLDEIGRGTSTYDGLAIARAVAEHIHNKAGLGCKTLFATHYHELTELADRLPRVKNYNVAVLEDEVKVVFLRRIVPGKTDKSYGIHVAKLAGLPHEVINRALNVLDELEQSTNPNGLVENECANNSDSKRGIVFNGSYQLPLINKISLCLDKLLELDISNITPIEAMNKLYEIQEEIRKNKDGNFVS